MRIHIDENIPQGKEAFQAFGEVIPFPGRALKREDLAGTDALIVRSVTRVDSALLEGTPVAFVGTATIGTDHIDAMHLREKGIGFASAPGCNAQSVAEWALSALAWLVRHRGLSCEGKVLGLVGHGHVGQALETAAEALGLKVLRCDPPRAEAGHPGPYLDLTSLTQASDILSFHVPLTREGPHATLKMLDADWLSSIRKPITLLNACRGKIAEEAALLAGKRSGAVRHLVLDVFPDEPSISPALAAACDLMTPHVAGYSVQGKLRGTEKVLQAFLEHFRLESAAGTSGIAWPEPEEKDVRRWMGSGSGADASGQALLDILLGIYPIQEDDAALRRSLLDSDPVAQFDRLRKLYPRRFEASSFTFRDGEDKKNIWLSNRLRSLNVGLD